MRRPLTSLQFVFMTLGRVPPPATDSILSSRRQKEMQSQSGHPLNVIIKVSTVFFLTGEPERHDSDLLVRYLPRRLRGSLLSLMGSTFPFFNRFPPYFEVLRNRTKLGVKKPSRADSPRESCTRAVKWRRREREKKKKKKKLHL